MAHSERGARRQIRVEALRQAIGKTLISMTREERMQVSFLSVMAAEKQQRLEQPDRRLAA
ncbi:MULTISPECIES: hypothetical protein [unclassified Thioalkalivibrio]|uniref:hypothetical protein n=1 Tax=unclassified Thioalkalivibrio TaxID=2621013 RepID=UPI0012DD223F|nr:MULTISPECIES: hypothetical protein [unclassified Thioalkalivibrio]